jgi:DNA-binding transcriptional MerR regulator
MPDSTLLLIGDLAARCGTTPKAIRTYELRSLIAPVKRSSNGYRYYDPGLARLVPVFTAMLSLGLTLRDITGIFAPSGPLRSCPSDAELRVSMVRAQSIYQEQLKRVDAEIAHLLERREAILGRLERCRTELLQTGPLALPEPGFAARRFRPGRVEYRTPA